MQTFTNGFRLGFSTGSFYQRLDELYDRVSAISGLHHPRLYPSIPIEVHVSTLDQLEGYGFDLLKDQLLCLSGKRIPTWMSIHAPTGVSLSELDWAIPRVMQLSEVANAQAIVVHPQTGIDPFQLAQRLGGKGAVENMDITRYGQTPEQLSSYIEAGFSVTLDVNHAHSVGGLSLVQTWVDACSGLITHYHISAHNGPKDPHLLYSQHHDPLDQLDALKLIPTGIMIHEGIIGPNMDPMDSINKELGLLQGHLPFQSPSTAACDI